MWVWVRTCACTHTHTHTALLSRLNLPGPISEDNVSSVLLTISFSLYLEGGEEKVGTEGKGKRGGFQFLRFFVIKTPTTLPPLSAALKTEPERFQSFRTFFFLLPWLNGLVWVIFSFSWGWLLRDTLLLLFLWWPDYCDQQRQHADNILTWLIQDLWACYKLTDFLNPLTPTDHESPCEVKRFTLH